MKSFFTLLLALSFTCLFSQSNPWESPLKICTSANGTTFGAATTFQDSSGVASIIRLGSLSSDTLMAAFQWFPAPKFSTYWDKIAIKFSYNGGTTWTAPTSCTFTGLPGGYQRPFDPSLVLLPSGQIRMYFSCGVSSPPPGGIDSYSALSNNGITYTFETTAKFDDLTKNAIDPSIINFGSTYFYNAWTGNQTDGAFRAISNNGITFTTQTTYTFDGSHLWLGNYMTDGSTLKFYGSGTPGNIWFNSSTNGITWTGYNNTNVIMAADPAVVKNKSGTYVMLYTGPPVTASVNENNLLDKNITLYPNVFDNYINLRTKDVTLALKVEIYDTAGKKVVEAKTSVGALENRYNLSDLSAGLYYCEISDGTNTVMKKIIKK